ncbi:MAG: hypothetical protein ABI980_07635 [Nitrospirota bacterium]|jgi:hypothetical protein
MKEEDNTTLPLIDDLTSQEFMRRYFRLPHLAKDEAKIELLAWLLVLGLFVTAILQTG